MKQKLEVQGLVIHLDKINDNDYVSLTDIAKQSSDAKPKNIIQNWMKNTNTLRFLYTWESLHNPNFKGIQMDAFVGANSDNRVIISPKKFIEKYNAIGITSKRGHKGGTYAHSDIAMEFCSWLSPVFKVYILKAFQELSKKEFERKNLEWHVSKLTNHVDDMRNLLDTIPGQDPKQNRLQSGK